MAAPSVEADPPAEEHHDVVGDDVLASLHAGGLPAVRSKLKHARVLQEEVTLLGEEQAELLRLICCSSASTSKNPC